MEHDLGLSSSEYSLVLSIFFVGYLLWEVPSNMMISRSTPSIFVPTLMVIWVSDPNSPAEQRVVESDQIQGRNNHIPVHMPWPSTRAWL